MKVRFFAWVFLTLSLWSCHKPKMLLPVNDNPGPHDINSVTQAYVFFEIHGGDTVARLNKNQLFTAMHWVVHVDRRLPLKKIIVPLQTLYKKRHKKSIHSNPGARMYLSHVDTLRNVLALDDFTDVEVETPFYFSRQYVEKYPKITGGKPVVHLDLQPGRLWVGSVAFAFPARKKAFLAYMDSLKTDRRPRLVFINADYNVDYGSFNNLLGAVHGLDSIMFRVSNKMFWYNPAEVQR